jgi:adenylate kinase family enzyme
MKLHILGAAGSGVTTLGRGVAERLNVPYFDSDDYFWIKSDPPFTTRQNPQQRNFLIRTDLNKQEDWILGGSIINWGDNVFPIFDLIVFLWIPPIVRMERLERREFERFGDVIYTDSQRIKQFEQFMEWANDYDNPGGIANRTLKAHEDWLSKTTVPILKIAGDVTTEERMRFVLEKLKEMNLL